MSVTFYDNNSYLKNYENKKNYKYVPSHKSKPIGSFLNAKNNLTLDINKLQDYSNYIEKKTVGDENQNPKSLSLQIIRPSNQLKKYDQYSYS